MLTAGEKENIATIRRLLEAELLPFKFAAASLLFDLIERLDGDFREIDLHRARHLRELVFAECKIRRLEAELSAIKDPLGIGVQS